MSRYDEVGKFCPLLLVFSSHKYNVVLRFGTLIRGENTGIPCQHDDMVSQAKNNSPLTC